MLQPSPKPQQPNVRPQDYVLAAIGWLLFPALMGALFTRQRFGLRAVVSPARYVLGTLAFVVFHEIGRIEAHWHNPPFFEGFAWRYFELMYALAAWHIFGAWRAFRRREQRHNYSLGEPYLMLLGIPYRTACLLDAAFIFVVGYLVRDHVDVALGVWLMVGGAALAMLVVMGAQQQFNDIADLMDAGLYAGNIQDRVEQPDTASHQRIYASAPEEEEVSTSAQVPRK